MRLCLILVLAAVVGCGKPASSVHHSPNGVTTIRELPATGLDPYLLAFEILEKGMPPQQFVTRASTVHNYEFIWDKEGVTIESSDIGLLRYDRSPQGVWTEGEISSRTSPDKKYAASLEALSSKDKLNVSINERYPDGGMGGFGITLDKTWSDVRPEHFVLLRRGARLTSRGLEWMDNDSLVLHLKQGDIRIVRDGTSWVVADGANRGSHE